MSLVDKTNSRYLDDKECLDAWLETGTSVKAAKKLYKRGYKNPRTGEPPNDRSIRSAAYRWILLHPDEGREILSEYGASYTDDDDEWKMWLVEKALAHQSWGKRRYELWIQQHDLVEYDKKVQDALPYLQMPEMS